MRRLIDENVLTEHLARCIEEGNGLLRAVCMAIKCFVEQMPTVDAVEVVRCKDCKHWRELNGKDSGKPVGYGYCRNLCGINGIAYEDSFCSYGERRTDG